MTVLLSPAPTVLIPELAAVVRVCASALRRLDPDDSTGIARRLLACVTWATRGDKDYLAGFAAETEIALTACHGDATARELLGALATACDRLSESGGAGEEAIRSVSRFGVVDLLGTVRWALTGEPLVLAEAADAAGD